MRSKVSGRSATREACRKYYQCGARKICDNIKKSQNIKMTVVWKKWLLKDQYWLLSYFFYMSITSNMLQIFENMFIVILCVLVCDVTDLEIYLSLLIKPFSYSRKCLLDEIGNMHHFWSFFMEVNKTNYFWMGTIQKVRTLQIHQF